mmetsp:Transcript_35285/g.69221  ORF Transcript_35285/g.69221 Transcript_35285/m.69221 type:complete len:84 (-) Transcript_35285:219-470(-)
MSLLIRSNTKSKTPARIGQASKNQIKPGEPVKGQQIEPRFGGLTPTNQDVVRYLSEVTVQTQGLGEPTQKGNDTQTPAVWKPI